MKTQHWQIPLSKRFRALKLWFVLRSFGKKGLQEHVRKGVYLATEFEKMVLGDDRFEIPAKRHLGMVVFRLKGDNDLTEVLLKRINRSGKLHMVPASIKGKYIIRYTVTSQYTTISDITRDWALIQTMASEVLSEENLEQAVVIPRPISASGQMKREGLVKKDFGISLILSNVPMSPKFINGSFAALFEANDIIVEFAKTLGRNSIDLNGRPIRLSPRKRLKEQSKQYSFDLCLIPHARRNLYPSKQASLDSKIEEIFDTSIDSDPCDTDTEASFAAELEERAANEKARAAISPDDEKATSPPGDCDDDDVTKPDRKAEVVNGVQPLFCKKCGSVIEYET